MTAPQPHIVIHWCQDEDDISYVHGPYPDHTAAIEAAIDAGGENWEVVPLHTPTTHTDQEHP
jgi:agmatine/peptidylarginine deiminase